MTELRMESEHPVGICCVIGHDLQDVPVFDDFALSIETEDVHSGPDVITGPILAAMKDNVVAFGDYVFEFHALAGVIASGFLEIGDEAFLAVGDAGIVLDVLLACVPLDRIARAALVEHQVVESHDVLLIALQVGHCRSLAPAKIIRERQGKAPAADLRLRSGQAAAATKARRTRGWRKAALHEEPAGLQGLEGRPFLRQGKPEGGRYLWMKTWRKMR